MKKESVIGYVLRLALTLMIITAVVAALLAGVNAITRDRIAVIDEEKTLAAMAAVLPDAKDAEPVSFTDDSGIVSAVYASPAGYAVMVEPVGFGDTITMMVGVDKEGKVLGISVVKHGETAGLGAVAAAKTARGEAFRSQFVGMSGTLTVTKDGGQVDAISSATITSRAVTAGVNAALACVENFG